MGIAHICVHHLGVVHGCSNSLLLNLLIAGQTPTGSEWHRSGSRGSREGHFNAGGDKACHYRVCPVRLFSSLGTTNPRRSLTSLEAISSLRSSLSGVVRPTSSLTKLLPRHSSVTRDSKRSSFESLSRNHVARENSFDSWDTSAVGPHIREAVLQSTPPSAGSGLEPIPGSRPESPANALDGPFLPQSPTYSTPNFTRPFSRQRSSSDECHIHPLFRTNSPTPPPTPTPGTVVTAAPMAGQVINGRTLNRMRSGSLPSSPSPLIRSASFDAWSGARSFTPPTRGATPPIPDFILTAGAESGIDGYGKHRASLRSTEVDTGQ